MKKYIIVKGVYPTSLEQAISVENIIAVRQSENVGTLIDVATGNKIQQYLTCTPFYDVLALNDAVERSEP